MGSLQLPIDHHPAVDRQARGRRQVGARTQADGRQHQIASHLGAVRQMGQQAVGAALQTGQHRPQVEARAEAFQPGLHRRGSRRRQQPRHHLLARRHQLDAVATEAEVVGKLATDQAGAQHQHPLLARSGSTETGVILQVIDRENRLGRIARHRHANHLGTQGQDQVAVWHRLFANP